MKHSEIYDLARKSAQALIDLAAAEGREFTEAEQTELDAHIESATTAKAAIDRQTKTAGLLAALGDIPAPTAAPTAPVVSPVVSSVKARLTPGEAFTQSDAWQATVKSYGGSFPSGPIQMPSRVSVGAVKALLTSPGFTDVQTVISPQGIPLTDLSSAVAMIPTVPGTSVRVMTGTFTNAAAVVAEGAAKPEATLTFASTTITMATIAHVLPVTKQALEHNPTLAALIDNYMVGGVKARIDTALGTTVAAAATTAQAFTTDLRTTLRKALTKAQKNGAPYGFVPNGILISVDDAETLDLEAIATLSTAPGGAPAQVGSVWRLPLVVCHSLAAGFAYVGDLKLIQLYVSTAGIELATGWVNNQFAENELTLRAETEAVGHVMVPGALVKADLTV